MGELEAKHEDPLPARNGQTADVIPEDPAERICVEQGARDAIDLGHDGEPDDLAGAVARRVYFDSLTIEQAAAIAEVGRLLRERARFEEEIEQLKTRKGALAEAAYESELERLFVGLAKVNRSIKRGGQ